MSFVVAQLNLSGKAILWNVLVFNLPVFLDFVHTFNCVPAEKVGKSFKYMLDFTVVGLLISVFLSFIGIGILLNIDDSYVQNMFSNFLVLESPFKNIYFIKSNWDFSRLYVFNTYRRT